MDREKVVSTFEKTISVCKEDGCDFVDLTFEDAEQILALLKEQGEEIDIRDVDGLWCDDITFCQETCECMDCPRNKHHIRDRSVPHSYFVEIPLDCPKKMISEYRRSHESNLGNGL